VGKDSFETTALLGQDNQKRNVLCIGPAGENRSRMASIMNDGTRAWRAAVLGQSMGSKNLKAIVVEGDQKKPARRP